MPASKTTNIIAWNANGISTRKAEFHNLLESEDFAAALVCETHLTEKSRLTLSGFECYRNDRSTRGGGTVILVKRCVKSFELPLPTLNSIEATAVQVETPAGPLRLIAAYIKPQAKLHTADLDKLLDSKLPTVIAGDLNAKHTAWNSRVCNSKGRQLLAHSLKNDFVVAGPLDPTHHSGDLRHSADVLDIAIYKNMSQSIELQTLTALSSDHNPVKITIGDEFEVHQPTLKHNLRRCDWEKFRDELDARVDSTPINTPQNIDDAVVHLTTAIFEALDLSAPRSTPGRCSIFDLPAAIKKTIAAKNRARRQWQKYRTADLKLQYIHSERQLSTEIQNYRNSKWETAVGELKLADNSIWNMARRLTGKKEPSPPIQGRSHLACSPRDKAEVLAETLEEAFTPNPPTQNTQSVESQVKDFMDTHSPASVEASGEFDLCTAKEVVNLAAKLPNKKAPGQDDITNELIKQLSAAAGSRLVDIFNAGIRLQHFPSSWKEAKVVVFPKPGKSHRDPSNYRPISLLSGLSKLFERLILNRLGAYANENNLFIAQQFGFRKHHSCNHQLLRVVNQITHGFNQRKATGVVFLDVAKAFDRVWHQGLLFKLIQLKFPQYLVNLVASYLGGRSFFVSHRGERSESRPIKAGVPQGSIIAPFLFNVYTNDMPTDLHGTEIALYADDAAIYSTSFDNQIIGRNLQDSLAVLAKWYVQWRMALNTSKTTATLFERARARHMKTAAPSLTLNGEAIQWTPTSKYLGITLDTRLKWKEQIASVKIKANRKLGALYPLLRSTSMPLHLKVHLYKAAVRPVMTYASPIWSTALATRTTGKALQTVQNRALKMATGAPVFARTAILHRDLGVDLLNAHILQLNQSFYATLESNSNPLISKQRDFIAQPWDKYARPILALRLK